MQDTAKQYDHVIDSCKDIFLKKSTDYGTSWRVLRTISVVDQLFIKAQRIRTIQQKGTQRIDDNIAAEFQGIINYGVIGLIQLQLPASEKEEIPLDELTILVVDKPVVMGILNVTPDSFYANRILFLL